MTSKSKLRQCALSALAAVLGAACNAGADVSWQLGNDKALIEEARALLSEGELPEGRSVVELVSRRSIDVRDDAVVETVEQIFFYPDAQSVQSSGSDSVSWDTYDQDLTVLAAAVVAADGTLHRFEPKTAQVLTESSTSVFTTDNQLVLQLPGLDPGAISVLSYRRTGRDTDNFLMTGYAQTAITSVHREFAVSWAGQKPIWHADPEAFDCTEAANSVTCVSRLSEPADMDDSVFYADVLPRFMVAANGSWNDVTQQMLGYMQDAMSDRSVLEPLVSEFQSADDPIARILNLVSKNIRYVSFSEAEHAYRPHRIGDTLAKRYGDCKDKSAVLLALLQAFDIDAYPVLVATYSQRADTLKVPSRAHFDHMVICANFPEGERCFDPTETHAGPDTSPRRLQGKARLVLKPGSVPTTVPRDPFVWQFSFENELKFQGDGSQTEALQRTYNGAYAAWFRGELSAREAGEQDEWLEEQHKGVVEGFKAAQYNVSSLDQPEKPLTIVSETRYDSVATPGSDLSYTDGAFWIKSEIKQHRVDNEHYGIDLVGALYRSTYRFDLQDHWTLTDLGPQVELDSRFGRFERRYERDGDDVIITTEFRVPSQRLEPGDFAHYNRFIELAGRETNIRFWAKAPKN